LIRATADAQTYERASPAAIIIWFFSNLEWVSIR
jgi:hypothetical protein